MSPTIRRPIGRRSSSAASEERRARAIVATASLEMGIDIGYIDLVCQIGSPRSIATSCSASAARATRSARSPKAGCFRSRATSCWNRSPWCAPSAAASSTRSRFPSAARYSRPADRRGRRLRRMGRRRHLFDLCRRAWPYRNLVARGLRRDRAHAERRHRAAAPSAAPTCIATDQRPPAGPPRRPARRDHLRRRDSRDGRVPRRDRTRRTFVGTRRRRLCRREPGGRRVPAGQHVVAHAQRPRRRSSSFATPKARRRRFRSGSAKRPAARSSFRDELSQLRRDLADSRFSRHQRRSRHAHARLARTRMRRQPPGPPSRPGAYVAAQMAAVGMVPTGEQIRLRAVLRRIGRHAARDSRAARARINRAWGLALRKRFCRSFDFELQAAADDDGIVLSLGPQHSFPIEALFKMLNAENGQVPARAGPARRADVSGPLAVERHAVAGRAAAARRQARAAAPAAVPQRRSAGRRLSRNGRLPGEPSRRRRDSRPSARAADDARLPARGDGLDALVDVLRPRA